MPTLWQRLVGRWRLLWRRCPKCNGNEPLDCGVCHGWMKPSPRLYVVERWWDDFLDGH
jgi:hypothetical protein